MTNPTTRTRAESIAETAACDAQNAKDAARRILAVVGDASRGYSFAGAGRQLPIPLNQCMHADDLSLVCDAVLAGGTDAAKPAGAGGVADMYHWRGEAERIIWPTDNSSQSGRGQAAIHLLRILHHNGYFDHPAIAASSDTPAQGMEP